MRAAAALLLALTAPCAAVAQQVPVVATSTLKQQLDAIAAIPTGNVGIAVIDLASGETAAVNGDRPMPMASVVKLAVAMVLLDRVDSGRDRLLREIALPERYRHADGFTEILVHPGIRLSLANWIELMLTQSDNTASDLLFAEAGGPAGVQRWLTGKGITGIRVDRDIAGILVDNFGLPRTAGASDLQSLRDANRLPRFSDVQINAAARRFAADPRDSASPLAVARLLTRLDRGDLLRPASRAALLATLGRTRTGPDRLRAGAAAGSAVAHKTGTLRLISNDVGIVTRPDGRRFAIAVLVGGIEDSKMRAAIIADVARAVTTSR